MKTLALSSVIGAAIAAMIIYAVDFQNPASDVLIITLCVAVTASVGSLVTSLWAKRSGTRRNA